MIPTISSSDLLFECQWWASDRVAPPARHTSPEARWGLAWHELLVFFLAGAGPSADQLSAVTTKFEIDDPPKLLANAQAGFYELCRWMKDNPYGIDFTRRRVRTFTEISFAWNVPTGTFRRAESPDPETHAYPDRRPGDFCGTADLVARDVRTRDMFLPDYKTGDWGDLHRPEKLKQLRSLIRAARGVFDRNYCRPGRRGRPRGRSIVAVLHAPQDGAPSVYAHELTPADLLDHEERVRALWESRNSGYLRPGPHCLNRYCDAFPVCPSQTSNLVQVKGKFGALVSPEDVGRAHAFLQEARRTWSRLEEAATAEIRARVEEWGPCPRPDGKETILRADKPSLRISGTSIDEAVRTLRMSGEHEKADEVLRLADRLRELGAYKTVEGAVKLVAV